MCQNLSLISREDERLRVFENKVLRRTFGPKGKEVIGGQRKFQNEELHNLYFLPNIIIVINQEG
jgi:hypothetical protein